MSNDIRSQFLVYLIGAETMEFESLKVALGQMGFNFIHFKKVESALTKVKRSPPHVAIVDLEGQDLDADQYLERFTSASPETLHVATVVDARQINAASLLELGFYEVVERSQSDGRFVSAILDRAFDRLCLQYQAEEFQQQSQEKEIKIQALSDKNSSSTKQSEELFHKIRDFQLRVSQLETELEASESKTQRYISEFVKIKSEKDTLESQIQRFKSDGGTTALGFSGLMSSLTKCHSVEDAIQDWLNKISRLYQDTPVAFFRYIPNHSHLILSQCAGLEFAKVRGIGVPLAGLSSKEQKYFYSHVRFLANLRDLLKGAFNISEFEFRELVTDRGIVGLCVMFRTLKGDAEKRFFHDSIELLNLVACRNSLAFKVHEFDYKDDLTQLPTRRTLDNDLLAEMSRSGRTHLPLSALYIRIDNFPEHEKRLELDSEKIIRGISTILRKTSRLTDLTYRIEKDQFVVLLPNTDSTGAKIKAENLRSMVAKAQIKDSSGKAISDISVSVGISSYPKLCRDSEGLMISSDEALFEATKSGGNCVQVAASIDGM